MLRSFIGSPPQFAHPPEQSTHCCAAIARRRAILSVPTYLREIIMGLSVRDLEIMPRKSAVQLGASTA